MINSPVFIIGNPRSGTTMLQLMLTCNPGLFIPTECGFLLHLYSDFKSFSGNPDDIQKFVRAVFNCRKFELWNMEFDFVLEYMTTLKPQNYKELSSGIYECYGSLYYPGIARWGDKNNYYLNHIIDIASIFEEAQFLHIIRDGRDVACSYKDMAAKKHLKYGPNLPSHIQDVAKDWVKNVDTIRKSFTTIGWNRVVEIRYEDLVQQPDNTLIKVCKFLNLPFNATMLEFYRANREKRLVPEEFNEWKSLNSQKITTNRIKRWENELSTEEIETFELRASELLRVYGYA